MFVLEGKSKHKERHLQRNPGTSHAAKHAPHTLVAINGANTIANGMISKEKPSPEQLVRYLVPTA